MKAIHCFSMCLLLFWGSFSFSKPGISYPEKLARLHENLLDYMLDDTVRTDKTEIILNRLNEDGSWPGIVYDYKIDGPWKPTEHLSNLSALVRAYRIKGSKFYADPSVSKKIHLALNYWLTHNFQSPFSWWYNEIGTPQSVASILLLMEEELSETQVRLGTVILNRAKIKYTGENRVWVSGITLIKSLLLRNADSVMIASKSIQSVLTVTSGDGIQPDWSFHQHGSLLQLGNYGLGYAGDMMKWIKLLRNTPFAFDESKMSVLRNYILKGLQWANWKGKFDIPACGRKLLVNSASRMSDEFVEVLERMAKNDPEFAAEYLKSKNYEHLQGHKHFWRSEYQVKRTPDYYFSVKMVSSRVKGAESSRFENVNGYYMGDGITFLYQKGDEYENIFPFWDWKKLPGATIHQDDRKLPLLLAKGYTTVNDFVGGISDGTDGIAVMDYSRDGLEAKKSWFIFNDRIICLGSGINSVTGAQVTTAVNQCYLRDKAVIKTSGGERLSSEAENITDAKWILHDHTGYFFPEKNTLNLELKTVTGTWNNVSTQYPADEKISAGIFKLWIDHGRNPVNASYSYILVPACSAELLRNMESNAPFKIKNTSEIQEVSSVDGNLAGAVFYTPGSSGVFGGIKASAPCVMMIKKEKEGIRLWVSDPSQKLNQLQLTLKGAYQGSNATVKEGYTTTDITLPQKGEAGRGVEIVLKKNS